VYVIYVAFASLIIYSSLGGYAKLCTGGMLFFG
jgi:hypothetical protein